MKNIFELLKDKNQVLLVYGSLCMVAALIFIVISKFSSLQLLGTSVWIKPLKFCISSTLMAWTMGYYMHYLDNQNQVSYYNWSLIILLLIEIILITYQASRGKMSHFNQEDSLGRTIFSIMAVAITLFMLHTVFILLLFFTQKEFNAPDTLVLAIQISILITVLFAFEGFIMGAILKHTVGSVDGSEGIALVNWSKNYGDLRVAHFFGMHALQIAPLLSYYIAQSKRDVLLIALIYFAFVSYTLFQALQGKPFIKY